jgi:hypothetical protein
MVATAGPAGAEAGEYRPNRSQSRHSISSTGPLSAISPSVTAPLLLHRRRTTQANINRAIPEAALNMFK